MTSRMVQAAACISCAQSWLLPDDLPEGTRDQFPLEPGPWENPCPQCGGTIWTTEPITREAFEELQATYRAGGSE